MKAKRPDLSEATGRCIPARPLLTIEGARYAHRTGVTAAIGHAVMHLLKLRTILVATDLTDSARSGTTTASALAEASGAEMHVVHVGDASSARVLERSGLREGDAHVHVASGDPDTLIAALAHELEADVIILGPHRAVDDRPLGSTAMSVVTNATVPCLVATKPLTLPIERVLAPVDLSDTARGALIVALQWASALRPTRARASTAAALVAMYVYPGEDKPAAVRALDAEFDRIRSDAGAWAGVAVERVVVSASDPADAICKYAADLTVLGTRGAGTGDVQRLGSVSQSVLRRAKVPVLLVPPAIWRAFASASAVEHAS